MSNNPFLYAHSVGQNKKYLMETPQDEKEYSPFLTNRFFSYFPDTIFYAEEMNMSSTLDYKLQYDYYFSSLRPRKRFSKWAKRLESSDLKLVAEYYQINNVKAKAALKILSKEQLAELKNRLNKGGQSI